MKIHIVPAYSPWVNGLVEGTNKLFLHIYRSDLDYMFKTECKLLPKWSIPQQITSRKLNLYMLETLKGDPIAGTFSAHQLWRFTPREGTKLAEEQKAVEECCTKEAEEERRRNKQSIACSQELNHHTQPQLPEENSPGNTMNDMNPNG